MSNDYDDSIGLVTPAASFEDAYRKLRQTFLERLRNTVKVFDNILAQQAMSPLGKSDLTSAMLLAHNLAGSGATFGFPEISVAGQKVDVMLDQLLRNADESFAIKSGDFTMLESLTIELRNLCAAATERDDQGDGAWHAGKVDDKTQNVKKEHFVLVIEDDVQMNELLCIKLRQRGVRVTGVSNGEAAMKIIGRDIPDLIILDIKMPGMGGHELLRLVKQNPAYVSVPVLMLTGVAQEKDVVSALHAGAIDYVVKPVDVEQLIGRIEKILDASRFNVVIADNDLLILQLLEGKFRTRGFNVRLIDDGKKAWNTILRTLPDLVILDRMMPGMEGLAVLNAMRAEEATKRIPVIIVSARSQERDMDEGYKRGAQDYIAKPFIVDDLIARSVKLLNKSA